MAEVGIGVSASNGGRWASPFTGRPGRGSRGAHGAGPYGWYFSSTVSPAPDLGFADGHAAGLHPPVPVHPALVAILRDLIEEAGLKPGDLLFPGEKGGLPAGSVFRRVWRKARKAVLIEHEYSSPVGKRAYDLRHTCLTTWLNNGIPPAQVAAWAGNSVPVLLATYTRCITGQLTELQGRIEEPQRLPTVPAAVKGPSKNFGKFSGKPAAESRSKPAPAGLTPSPPGAVPALPKLPRRVR